MVRRCAKAGFSSGEGGDGSGAGAGQGGIRKAAPSQGVASFLQRAAQRIGEGLGQTPSLQEVAEFPQSGAVRHGFSEKIDAGEFAHAVAVVDGVLRGGIGQMEPGLQQVHPEHLLRVHGGTSPTALGVVGTDGVHPFLPGDQLLHGVQENLPPSFPFAKAVFKITDGLLLHNPTATAGNYRYCSTIFEKMVGVIQQFLTKNSDLAAWERMRIVGHLKKYPFAFWPDLLAGENLLSKPQIEVNQEMGL